MKPALLVIDIQNEFFHLNQAYSDSLKSTIECINAAVDLFRKKNLPIVVIQHKSEGQDLVPGKSGFAVPESVKAGASRPTHREGLRQLFHEDRACRKIEKAWC
jgi:nicotinamidase-related amidase